MTHRKLQTAVGILEKLIAFNTESGRSNLPLVAFADSHLRAAGFATSQNQHDGRANLLGVVGPKKDGGVVLSGHSDVVDALGQKWKTNPFQMSRADGRLFGRGVCDMKGFLACVFAVADEFANGDLQLPLYIAVSRDEEVGSLGMPDMLKLFAEIAARPSMAFVGEPTKMEIVAGLKAGHEMRTTFIGAEAHSSMPATGVSATAFAARFAVFLQQVGEKMAANPRADNLFSPPFGTINIGTIVGGTAFNIIAGKCVVEWHYRALPDEDGGAILGECENFINETLLPMMKKSGHPATITTETVAAYPGLAPDEKSPALSLAKKLLNTTAHRTAPFGADAGHFQKHGIPAVLVGPGDIRQAHKPDEFVDISQLNECLNFLDKVREHLCGG